VLGINANAEIEERLRREKIGIHPIFVTALIKDVQPKDGLPNM